MNINIHNKIFHDANETITFLIERGIISQNIVCACLYRCNLTKYREYFVYRCENRSCRKRISILKKTEFKNTKLQINDIILMIYFYLYNLRNFQSYGFVGIAESSLVSFRKNMHLVAAKYISKNSRKIGGPGIKVQVDETVIARGRLITNPSHADDELPNTVWLFGGIEDTVERRFFLKIVPNRRIETLAEVMRNEIEEQTILISDGHPSYPGAFRLNNFQEHRIVIHNDGFTNEAGDHTNYIENLWSHLKTNLRTMHGVRREEMANFVTEFTLRNLFISNNEPSLINNIFINILHEVFEDTIIN